MSEAARVDIDPAPVPRSYFFEDLEMGLSAHVLRTVTADDIQAFADISGDYNPVHLDEDYAAGTMFKACIAHGILSASYVSAVFGMHLPGPGAIYISQTLNFKAPVFVGDEVRTDVEVQALFPQKRRAIFACTCHVGARLVLDGEAVIMVPSRP
ncbi:MAG: MaoC family dehydratase, partial [Pseudomonadota bacterium]